MKKDRPTLEELTDLICELIPQDILKKQENEVFGVTVTFRDRFIRHCQFATLKPKYSLEESRPIILKILEKDIHNEEGEIKFELFEELFYDVLGWLKWLV